MKRHGSNPPPSTARPSPPPSPPEVGGDGEINKVVKALNGIADAIREQAQATVLLARATSGEFDDEGEEEPDPDAKPLPPGYRGMR